jgi:hypothetical protein
MKRIAVFLAVLSLSVIVGRRVQSIRKEGSYAVNNVVRIQAEKGVPRNYVEAARTTDFLSEPLYVRNGRALVSTGRVGKFRVGQKVRGKTARIISVSNGIDLDTGMFVIRFSERISGSVFVEQKYTGFFLPLDAEIPEHAKIVAKDNERVVATGLREGEKVAVK